MDFMEFRRETTRFLREAQYLPGQSQAVGPQGDWGHGGQGDTGGHGGGMGGWWPRYPTMAPGAHKPTPSHAAPVLADPQTRADPGADRPTDRQTDRRTGRAAAPDPSALTL